MSSVEVRGFPCLQFQWQSNGVPIPGATSRTLAVAVAVGTPPSTNIYTVTASNALGSTNASARLAVVRRPCLQITELMSTPTNSALLGHFNWFELTNCDTNDVNLQGYRFRDAASLAVASTIANAVILKPGESAVFVEFMSADAFKRWWGAGNLPPGLQIVTWGGWGLSGQGNDVIHFWNPGATDSLDTVATASHLAAIPGWSEELESFCEESFGCAALYLRDSVAAENGAFRAVEGGDIGSPGYTANPPPRLLGLSRNGARVMLSCRVVEGRTIRLTGKSNLADCGFPW